MIFAEGENFRVFDTGFLRTAEWFVEASDRVFRDDLIEEIKEVWAGEFKEVLIEDIKEVWGGKFKEVLIEEIKEVWVGEEIWDDGFREVRFEVILRVDEFIPSADDEAVTIGSTCEAIKEEDEEIVVELGNEFSDETGVNTLFLFLFFDLGLAVFFNSTSEGADDEDEVDGPLSGSSSLREHFFVFLSSGPSTTTSFDLASNSGLMFIDASLQLLNCEVELSVWFSG